MEKNIMRPRGFKTKKKEDKEFEDRVIEVKRVSRVVKGGRRIRFRALVVVGDMKGKVGIGIGKANEVLDAVNKAIKKAKKNMIIVPIVDGTIPHEIKTKYKASKIILRPASSGTSIVAGSCVRSILELAGINDILSKIIGSNNKLNNSIVTIKALSSFNEKIISDIEKFNKK